MGKRAGAPLEESIQIVHSLSYINSFTIQRYKSLQRSAEYPAFLAILTHEDRLLRRRLKRLEAGIAGRVGRVHVLGGLGLFLHMRRLLGLEK